MRHHPTIALLAVAALTGLTACGDDATTADTTAATAAASTTGTVVDGGVLTIALGDFAFGGLPEAVPAGTKLAVENTSTSELHEIVALRIPDAETRSAAELIALPETELLTAVGPIPATVLLAAPGAPQVTAVGDGTLAEPGRYLIVCAIPTGVDPAEYLAAAAESDGPPDVPGGPPHFVHGMFAELVVE